MDLKLVGNVNNIREAANELHQVYGHESDTSSDTRLGKEDLEFMIERIRDGESRKLFLWLLDVVIDITATMQWWKQSEKFMTEVQWVRKKIGDSDVMRRLSQSDFENGIPDGVLDVINRHIEQGDRAKVQEMLPDNYIRRGYAKIDYQALRQVFEERNHYSEGDWATFCRFVETLPYAGLITETAKNPVWEIDG